MIRIILWDIDGTLLDFLKAEYAGIRMCFDIFGLGECTDAMIADYSSINSRYWKMLERGEMSKPEILVNRFRDFFAKYGLDVSKAEAFNEEYQVRLGDTICFPPHALETVTFLKEQSQVLQCAVTNGTKIAQDRKLSKSGLDQILDHIFISEEIGVEKPNMGFFEKVFECLGVRNTPDTIRPSEILIVGDSMTSDIRGGINAGIKTCWYNPKHVVNSYGYTADYEISDIEEVLGLLKL